MLNKEAANINYIVFGLTRLGLEPMIYHGDIIIVNKTATTTNKFEWKY
jgi:hypothetical protein